MNQLQRDLQHRICSLHGEWIKNSLELYAIADQPRPEALAAVLQELIDALASAMLAYNIPEQDMWELLRRARACYRRKRAL